MAAAHAQDPEPACSATMYLKALQYPRLSWTLACVQVGRYGPELFDFSAERVTRSVTESLQRLQIPYIDLIQCHDIEFGSLDQVRPCCCVATFSVAAEQPSTHFWCCCCCCC